MLENHSVLLSYVQSQRQFFTKATLAVALVINTLPLSSVILKAWDPNYPYIQELNVQKGVHQILNSFQVHMAN